MAKVFNPLQKRAIEHAHGPMLVVAGAGTGKTTVLTERVARLIQKKLARPNEIVALTYTIAAADELRTRVKARLKESAAGLQALNFHSYCYRLLDQHGRNFDIVDEFDLKVFLRKHIHDLPLEIFRRASDPGKFLGDLNEFFSRCLDELVSAPQYTEHVAAMKAGRVPLQRVGATKDALSRDEIIARCEEIAAVYSKVETMLAERNLGTFGMQITRAVELLRSDPAVLAAERAHAKFILVDEFQDSNQALIELVRLLAGEEQNVFAVGDPDQAIYRFRGASAAAFDSFHRAFPGARQVALAENYRSLSPILDLAYRVIQSNHIIAATSQMSLLREPLRSAREEQARKEGKPLSAAPVTLVIHDGAEQEAFDIVEEIQAQHDAGAPWSDFCVLYRQRDHRDEMVATLRERHIPFVVEGLDALDVSEVRDLIAAMRALAWPTNEIPALLRLASFPEFGLDPAKLRDQFAAARTTLLDVLKANAAGKNVAAVVDEFGRKLPATVTKITTYLAAVAKRFGLAEPTPAFVAFRDFAATWERKPLAEKGTAAEFLEYLEWFRYFEGKVPLPQEEDSDAVRLMTVHAAKGREFRHVYIIRATQQSFPVNYRERLFEFPHALRSEGAAPERDPKGLQQEEERRLFYVAMTRAMESLTLLAKKDRWGKEMPAVYLAEIAKAGAGPWTRRQPRALTFDLAAAAEAALPAASAVAPWLLLPMRDEMRTMPLSASSIEAYDTCPLKFKLRYDWKLPEEPTGALLYGATMHQVLRDYFDQVKTGDTPAAAGVIANFRAQLGQAGIADPMQRTLYERDGVQQLTDFVTLHQGARDRATVLHTEQNFKVDIAGVQVRGRIDRVDRLPDGTIAIVDYKTGKAKDQKDADKSLQLSIYALAAPRALGTRPDHLVLYNLVNNDAIVSKRTPDKLQAAEEKVREVAENVRAGNFSPTPGYHCRWCSYRDLCPATEQKLVHIEVAAGGVN